MSGSQSALYGGGLKPRFQEFKTSGTFTPSAGLIAAGGTVSYDLRGGGGGGGVGVGPRSGGGSSKLVGYATVLTAQTVTLASAANAGTDGGNSSFGSIIAYGGKAGGSTAGGAGGSQGVCGGIASGTGGFSGAGGGEGGGPVDGAANANTGGGGGGAGGDATPGKGGSGYLLLTWWE